ncbi:MAG TPA: hypothetical protein VGB75_17735 [Jatrophihabitans sp.]|jgi:hypothetical protein
MYWDHFGHVLVKDTDKAARLRAEKAVIDGQPVDAKANLWQRLARV